MTVAFALTPDRNSHGNDFTGAFDPEAKAFAKFYGAPLPARVSIDPAMGMSARRAQMLSILSALPPHSVDLLGLFTHGLRSRLPQFDWTIGNVADLAHTLGRVLKPTASIALYACSTATGAVEDGPGGEGGFADALRDALVLQGMNGGHIDAHEKADHTTCNPLVRRFEIQPNVLGGDWLVAPGSPDWKAWNDKLRGEMHQPRSGNFRFRFPLMTRAEIQTELHSTLVKP